jgi:hypothetical protein
MLCVCCHVMMYVFWYTDSALSCSLSVFFCSSFQLLSCELNCICACFSLMAVKRVGCGPPCFICFYVVCSVVFSPYFFFAWFVMCWFCFVFYLSLTCPLTCALHPLPHCFQQPIVCDHHWTNRRPPLSNRG